MWFSFLGPQTKLPAIPCMTSLSRLTVLNPDHWMFQLSIRGKTWFSLVLLLSNQCFHVPQPRSPSLQLPPKLFSISSFSSRHKYQDECPCYHSQEWRYLQERSRELAQESGGFALTGQEEAEHRICLVSVAAPHSQAQLVSIEASAPFLPLCHSLDSLISLWKHAALKILWVGQSIVSIISTKIHLNTILEWCLTLWKPAPSWAQRPAGFWVGAEAF